MDLEVEQFGCAIPPSSSASYADPVGFTRAELESFRDATVPDLVGPGLKLLFVGINPGLWTAATQTHFAHPGNRFYPALLLGGVIEREIDRGTGMSDADREHLVARGIGITNLVQRGDGEGVGADRRRAARGRRATAAHGSRAPAARRRRRRHHRLPRCVRIEDGRARPPTRPVRRRRAVGGPEPEWPQRPRDDRDAGRRLPSPSRCRRHPVVGPDAVARLRVERTARGRGVRTLGPTR